MVFPCMSVIVMSVLLNVAVMCAMPSASTTFLARFAPAAFAWAIFFFRRGFFLPAIARRGPFLVRGLVCVRWPRTGKFLRCREPRYVPMSISRLMFIATSVRSAPSTLQSRSITWRNRATSASRRSRTRASGLTPVSARIFFAFEGPIPKMYGRAYWIFLSRGRSTPAMRAIPYPCRCLCLGLRLQMTRITPRRLITLQCSQIGLTLVRTFNAVGSGKNLVQGKNPIKSRTIDGVVSSRKGSNYGVLRSSTRRHDPTAFRNPRMPRRRAIASHALHEPLVHPGGVLCQCDRPAHVEVGRPAAHGVAGRDGPGLVAGLLPRRADAGHDDPGIGPECRAQQRQLAARGDHAAQPRLQRDPRKALRFETQVWHAPPDDLRESVGIVGRQDRDPNEREVARGG